MNSWNKITSSKEVDQIIEQSQNKTQILFKDSVSCGISAFAKEKLTHGNELLIEKADFNYLDLLSYRNVSNYIAEVLGVIHQSPQIIVLKNKEVIYSTSHHSIDPKSIAKHL